MSNIQSEFGSYNENHCLDDIVVSCHDYNRGCRARHFLKDVDAITCSVREMYGKSAVSNNLRVTESE